MDFSACMMKIQHIQYIMEDSEVFNFILRLTEIKNIFEAGQKLYGRTL